MDAEPGRTAHDDARHRLAFPKGLFDRLAALGVGRSGQRLLDLGTGTGSLARGFARRGCVVRGLDPSEPRLAEARRRTAAEGLAVTYLVGRAEDIELAGGSVDVVTAGQCWQWFDGPQAARQCRRVLVPGGALAICQFDWIALRGNVVAATEALIRRYNPHWPGGGNPGMYPAWALDVAEAGLAGIETFSFDVDVPSTPEAWRERVRACAGVAGSLPPDAVAAFDDELAGLLRRGFPQPVLRAPHRVWALVARTPGV
ncbi:MAG TPA: methyltransferase domain-containing protein [Acidimicrobiales bacterium]|nr:methyltransferase domain-containing protein [Acidimicrobiales bacterium]